MQPTNKPSKQQERCIYCGSTTRGKGCRYAPHGVHFFPDNPAKCSYCGSTNYGRGCHVNPTGDTHVHGVNYNSMFKENIQSFLDNKVFIKELKKEFKDFNAYTLGIIDDNGNKLKTPITEEEKSAYSPMIKTILRLKRFLGSKVDLLDATTSLEQEPVMENIEQYKKLVEYKDRIDSIVNELYETLDRAAADGLKLEDVKSLIRS